MNAVLDLISALEQAGGNLALDAGRVKVRYPDNRKQSVAPILAHLREHREEVARLLQERSAKTTAAPEIPKGAILLAPRYDSKPLVRIPSCWCCQTPYGLDRIQAWEGKQYAHLEPRCGCLDTAQAIRCCGLCTEHCACRTRRKVNN